MTTDKPPFVYTPLGPWQDADDKSWCCGLHCGKPCPYGLKLKPVIAGPEYSAGPDEPKPTKIVADHPGYTG